MNIQDIMLRDIADAEREQRERADREAATIGDRCGLPRLAVAMWLAVALAALGAAFAGGMAYQSRRALKADRDFAAWTERVERKVTERARAMNNYELLNAMLTIGDPFTEGATGDPKWGDKKLTFTNGVLHAVTE